MISARKALLAATVLCPVAFAHAQSCQSQASMDLIAAGVWNQVMGDQVAECGLNGSGPEQKGLTVGVTCVPITLAPGDVLPGDGTSITDSQGNTWSLVAPSQDGNGHWMGGIVFNGEQRDVGYFAALRFVNGTVYAEEAKGSGWQIADPSNPGDTGNTWTYVGNPGPGSSCGGGAGQASAMPTDSVTPAASVAAIAAAGTAATASPATTQAGAGSSCTAPAVGGITPGSGSFTDASGNTFAIDPGGFDTATINGQPITPNGESSQTAQMALVNGQVYGQDENTLQWFEMAPGPGGDRTWAWQPLTGLPTSGQAPVPTTRWDTASAGGSAAGTCGNSTVAGVANPAAQGQPPPPAQGCTNASSGTLVDLLAVCADPAVQAHAGDAALCAQAQQALAQLAQASQQLQQSGVTPAAAVPAGPVCVQ